MTHEEFDERIDAYLSGGQKGSEQADFEAHASSCDRCAKTLGAAREFARFLSGAIEPHGPPEDLDARILGAIKAEGFRTKRRFKLRPPPIPRFVKVAAGALFAVGVGAVASTPVTSLESLRAVASIQSDSLEFFAEAKDEKGGRFNSEWESTGKQTPSRSETERIECDDASEELQDSPTKQIGTLGELSVQKRPGEVLKTDSNSVTLTADLDFATLRADKGQETKKSAQIRAGDAGGRKDENENKVDPAGREAPDNRKIIRSGTLELEVDSFEKSSHAVDAVLKDTGGYVASSTTQKLPNGKVRGEITVRVPAERFDEALARLRELGDVKNQSLGAQDVTKQYVDLESQLRNKRTLEERLLELLKKSKGNVKELLEVEKELGTVRAAIEQIEGEFKYLSHRIALSTLTLRLAEKEIGQPFEYLLTQSAQVRLAAHDVPTAYERAQEVVRQAGGVITNRNLQLLPNHAASAVLQARLDMDRFPQAVEDLKKLGEAAEASVTQEQQSIGGDPDKAAPGAPVRKEQATIHLAIQTPPETVMVTATLELEADNVRTAHEAARGIVTAGGSAKVLGGGLEDTPNSLTGRLDVTIPAVAFPEAFERLKNLGKVKTTATRQEEPTDKAPLRRELARITVTIRTPERIVTEETGFKALFTKTLAGTVRGITWSARMLVVGTAYLGPWAVLPWGIWKLARRKKAAAS